MLVELEIENYAVVEKLRVSFGPGLNLLTGETGSGKSIVVDALALLFGARASADSVRGKAKQARVSGRFEPTQTRPLLRALADAGLELEDGELLVERQILASGKSRAYVNGRAATAALLKTLAEELGDIHGQHEQQNLFAARTQMEMLDEFAKTGKLVEETGAAYGRWRELGKKLAELRGDEQERLRRLDLLRFQAQEIEGAGLSEGEDEDLDASRTRLRNTEALRDSAAAAYEALYEGAHAASAQLKKALTALEELGRYEARFEASSKSLAESRAIVDDAGLELGSYLEGLEADPGKLDQVEDRLAEIEKLKRKYGSTLEEVIAHGAEARRMTEELESADQSAAAVEAELTKAAEAYLAVAGKLAKKRAAAAKKLGSAVEKELASLAMEKAQFAVELGGGETEENWTASGFDRIEFLCSANPGLPPRGLAQTASGGELSRITLALKTCLAPKTAKRAGEARTLVFDEIDTGVGGRVAEAIGRRLKRLAEGAQVLCVTHLPQIAALADQHFRVDKEAKGSSTRASLTELDETARIEELARMLSGERVTDAALENARGLLAAS